MKTDAFLGHVKRYPNKCKPLGGKVRNKFLDYPLLTEIQFQMNKKQIWIDQRVSLGIKDFFPNINTLAVYLTKVTLVHSDGFLYPKKIKTSDKKHLHKKGTPVHVSFGDIFFQIKTADKWEKNIKKLHELVKLENAEYFVFLQPTMGLKGLQSQPLRGSYDEKVYSQWLNLPQNENYLETLRDFYAELKIRCKKISYCYDISNSVPPNGDVYHNMRHHNAKGNKLLAEKVWSILSKNLKK